MAKPAPIKRKFIPAQKAAPGPDPALARYPAEFAGLLSLGKPENDIDYTPWAEALGWHVPELIEMVLDEDLNWRDEHDPAVWAPIHALRILALIGPAEAAEPLLECLEWEEDWYEEVAGVYGQIGPAAIPLLRGYLDAAEHTSFARGRAADALAAIAQSHPAARDEVVSLLTAFLDRPAADTDAEEETLTAFVIGDLGDLKADSAYDAIRRAYAENRVDEQIIGLDDVERDFEMRPALDFSQPPELPSEPGVRIVLKCKACGRERAHRFPKVYYDLSNVRDEKKSAYDPLIIPQRVVCPKCGAVDQYEPGAMGHLALTASMLALQHPETPGLLPENQRIRFINFTSRWGPMHPQEALARYRRELSARPQDVSLRVGYANILKALGYLVEAEAEYRNAADLAPDNVEIWVGLAQVTGGLGNGPEAIRLWQRVAELATRTPMAPDQRRSLLQAAQESQDDLRQGRIPEYSQLDAAEMPRTQPTRAAGGKTGRNEPCPCGSGKKYKHCHGRAGA
jgi:tetratricopeptide (TPR) repeat protein